MASTHETELAEKAHTAEPLEYEVEFARRTLADHGWIARVSALGGTLCVYDGDVDRPGTWMECGRVAIRNGKVNGNAIREFTE